ncbi:MAG: hypothetical protein ACK48N_09260, partial [Planctomyces sp.]
MTQVVAHDVLAVIGELNTLAAALAAAFALHLAGEDLAAGQIEGGQSRDESRIEQLVKTRGPGWCRELDHESCTKARRREEEGREGRKKRKKRKKKVMAMMTKMMTKEEWNYCVLYIEFYRELVYIDHVVVVSVILEVWKSVLRESDAMVIQVVYYLSGEDHQVNRNLQS